MSEDVTAAVAPVGQQMFAARGACRPACDKAGGVRGSDECDFVDTDARPMTLVRVRTAKELRCELHELIVCAAKSLNFDTYRCDERSGERVLDIGTTTAKFVVTHIVPTEVRNAVWLTLFDDERHARAAPKIGEHTLHTPELWGAFFDWVFINARANTRNNTVVFDPAGAGGAGAGRGATAPRATAPAASGRQAMVSSGSAAAARGAGETARRGAAVEGRRMPLFVQFGTVMYKEFGIGIDNWLSLFFLLNMRKVKFAVPGDAEPVDGVQYIIGSHVWSRLRLGIDDDTDKGARLTRHLVSQLKCVTFQPAQALINDWVLLVSRLHIRLNPKPKVLAPPPRVLPPAQQTQQRGQQQQQTQQQTQQPQQRGQQQQTQQRGQQQQQTQTQQQQRGQQQQAQQQQQQQQQRQQAPPVEPLLRMVPVVDVSTMPVAQTAVVPPGAQAPAVAEPPVRPAFTNTFNVTAADAQRNYTGASSSAPDYTVNVDNRRVAPVAGELAAQHAISASTPVPVGSSMAAGAVSTAERVLPAIDPAARAYGYRRDQHTTATLNVLERSPTLSKFGTAVHLKSYVPANSRAKQWLMTALAPPATFREHMRQQFGADAASLMRLDEMEAYRGAHTHAHTLATCEQDWHTVLRAFDFAHAADADAQLGALGAGFEQVEAFYKYMCGVMPAREMNWSNVDKVKRYLTVYAAPPKQWYSLWKAGGWELRPFALAAIERYLATEPPPSNKTLQTLFASVSHQTPAMRRSGDGAV